MILPENFDILTARERKGNMLVMDITYVCYWLDGYFDHVPLPGKGKYREKWMIKVRFEDHMQEWGLYAADNYVGIYNGKDKKGGYQWELIKDG